MKRLRNTHSDVLVLPNFGSVGGNFIGDAFVVLDDDGRVVPMLNVDVGERYYVLRGQDTGTAILCEVVSALVHDVHGPRSTSERLRVELAPIVDDSPEVEVVP